jgi:Txe/YoeB family toxin of Txe-Axe toxin-antitoxin module
MRIRRLDKKHRNVYNITTDDEIITQSMKR